MRLNLLQSLYLGVHKKTFEKRLREQSRFGDLYVISVGNLSAGGTGKTPVVQYLARAGSAFRPLAVLRGYKANAPSEGILVSDGERILTGVREAGDEAMLLARTSGLRVAVGKNRSRVIDAFAEESRLILLDDAFQNPSVYRDHDLVLLDSTVPLEEIRLLPTGRFRENLDALKRAHSILLTRTDVARKEDLNRLKDAITAIVPNVPLFESIHASEQKIEGAFGDRVNAFCGIGNPEGFFKTLEQNGAHLDKKRNFPDHHFFKTSEIIHMMGKDDRIWFTTEKDFVRILELKNLPESVLERIQPLPIQLQILDNREAEFLETVFGPLLDLL